jgi:hypothetical protein
MPDPKAKSHVEAQTEEAWEEAVITEALGEALNPDGSINFEKLHAMTSPITLEELYPEGTDEDDAEESS